MVLPTAALSSDAGAATQSDDTIKEPHEHDVLCGRGGSINSWKGNERFRTLVEKRKRVYLTARFKREKRLIASSIVQEIQSLDPPGRFLSRNTKKGTWFVIDDDKARDKVSQALRENAPSIRAEIETEINEQRAEIQRSQHDPHHPPPNAPPNPYYPQGWGYFSYYGYAQQSSHPGGPMPPPPPHYHPGYSNGQWNTAGSAPQHPPHPSPPPPPQPEPTPPQQPTFNFSFSPKPNSKSQQREEQRAPPERQRPPQPPQPQMQAVYKVAPPQPQDDEKSIFDTTAELMTSVLPSSLASWTKDALSISGMSFSSNRDDRQDNASVASKPIQYVHQPEETQSVSSKRSVRFKDERSISGRSLEPRKNTKPPRIMHSSQINYPRRPRRNSNGAAASPGRYSNVNNPMAPVSSVNLSDHNDGMISLITTEGMNSIVEEGPIMMDEYEHREMVKQQHRQQHPNEEYKECDPAEEPLALKRSKATRRDSMGDESNSMLHAVANQIVMGLGSWDASTIACGPENGPGSVGVPREVNKYSDTMAVEIEGQEVQLVDMMDTQQDMAGDNSVIEDRLPPHDKQRLPVDWPSRVGSCHSFFNDSLAGASFFSSGNYSKGDAVSPADSMDMDVSSGTDPFSCGGSVGGASLCRVFDAEALTKDGHLPSPSLHNRMLTQMPSWERNLRLNGSQDGHEQDHCSLMTKSSEKLMGGSISTIGSLETRETSEKQQQQQQYEKHQYEKQHSGGMAWEGYKKE